MPRPATRLAGFWGEDNGPKGSHIVGNYTGGKSRSLRVHVGFETPEWNRLCPSCRCPTKNNPQKTKTKKRHKKTKKEKTTQKKGKEKPPHAPPPPTKKTVNPTQNQAPPPQTPTPKENHTHHPPHATLEKSKRKGRHKGYTETSQT